MRKGCFVFLINFFLCNLFAYEGIIFSYNEKYGLLDKDLNVVFQPNNRKIYQINDYIFVDKKDKCIVYDTNLSCVDTIVFEKSDFMFNLYPINKEYVGIDGFSKNYIYNLKNHTLQIYDEKFTQNGFELNIDLLLPVYSSGYYIDLNGNKLLNIPGVEKVYPFVNNRAVVLKNNWEKAIINSEGEILIDNIIDSGWQYKDGLIPVITKNASGFIDEKCEWVFKCPLVEEDKNNNPTGNPTLKCAFSEGYSYVHVTEKTWNIYNKSGKIIAKDLPYSTYSKGFSNNLLPVINNYKYGFINTKGEIVIPFIFDDAQDFKKGFASVVYNGKECILDIEGKLYCIEHLLNGNKTPILNISNEQ